MGLSSSGDWEGALRVTLAITPNDSHIVGTVLDVLHHHRLAVVLILPIFGVGDIDGVVLAAFEVIGDEPNWGFINFVIGVGGVVLIVDGAFLLLTEEGKGSDGKLGGKTDGGD
jgi:hypothetical protein